MVPGIKHPLAASAISETLARATQAHSVRANCSAQRRYIITALLPGFAARLPPIFPQIPMFGCQLDDRRLPFTRRGKPRVFGGYCAMMPSIAGEQLHLCRSAGGSPSNRSLRGNGRHSDGKRDGAAGFRRRAGRIPELLHLCNGYASVWLCRSLLTFAFHLATPSISWKRASRRERDAPLQLHAGTGRVLV